MKPVKSEACTDGPKTQNIILQNPRILGLDMASNGAFLDNSSFESFDR